MPPDATIRGIDDGFDTALANGGGTLIGESLECGLHQAGLAPEVVMHEPVIDTGALGDRAHGHSVGSHFLEEVGGGAHQRVLACGTTADSSAHASHSRRRSDDIPLGPQLTAREALDIQGAHVNEGIASEIEIAQDLTDSGALQESVPGETRRVEEARDLP